MSKCKFTFDEAKEEFCKRGYTYISGTYKDSKSKLTCVTDDGYYVFVSADALIMKNKKPSVFNIRNPYTILNVKKFVTDNTCGEFSCVSSVYSGSTSTLTFKHNTCGRLFDNKWVNIYRGRYLDNCSSNKTGLFCPHCNTRQLESTHALILKQVWLHEEPDTVVEDGSCINPNTNCRMPTDIVNHRLKIAIEIQSWFHDSDERKIKDKIKRDFWIENGYSFYAMDQRDYTVLEMIQEFFPDISEIPNYIDFEYANKFNDVLAQSLLNEYMSVTRVAEEMDCSTHAIYDAIYDNRISYPDDYKNNSYSSVVKLDLNGNFLSEYNTIQNASVDTGINDRAIARCLQQGRNYSGGYYWVKKADYISGEYTLSEYRSKKFLTPVNQYDADGNFIRHFESIIEASNFIGCSNSDIYRVITEERKTCLGYIWKI